jgi:aspartyl-tRNA(Asn)/glutamyl-tRNA(Gln) amidotransferase subunit A
MNADPAAWTLSEAVGALDARTISAVELTQALLARIEAWQPVVNAFVGLEAERALAQARASDQRRVQGHAGALEGAPLAHKDMFDRPGRVTGCGSKIRAEAVATKTATVLARLDAAGAVDLGRLNMSEFAMGPTGLNAHHGRAKNPWDPARVAGGSSSGSGAAVAAGLVFGALGSDTGGSIRLPAALCGVAGLKPTQGRVSRYGAMPLSFSLDCLGPLAPTVADVALLYQAIAGPDPLDPTSAALPVRAPTAPRLAGVTIGFCEAWAQDLDAATAQALADLRRLLASLGARIVEAELPDIEDLGELTNILSMAEGAAAHADYLRTRARDYGPQVRSRLRQGAAIPAPVYLRALALRARLTEQAVQGFGAADVLCLPALPFQPPLSAEIDATGAAALPQMIGAVARFTRGINYLGLPALALPIAWSGGLPVAAQFVGRPFAEADILGAGMAVEQALGFGRRLPSLKEQT